MLIDVTQDENGVWSAPAENPETYGTLHVDGKFVGELAGPVEFTFSEEDPAGPDLSAFDKLKEIKVEIPPRGPYKPKLTMSRDLLYRVLRSKKFRPKLTRKFLRRNTRGPSAANWVARMFSTMGGGN